MEKDIYVFICEDLELSKELISKYFYQDKITYAAMFSDKNRARVTQALDLADVPTA